MQHKKYKDESNRADFINYSAPGMYFLTVVTDNRERLFGEVKNGVMNLSEYGKIVAAEIVKIPEYHKRAILDEWVVMPDHIHMIIELGGWDFDNGISSVGEPVGTIHELSQRLPNPTDDEIKQYRSLRRKMIIFKIIGKLQMLTSKQINIIRNTPGRRNWQNDYYDHRIRSYDDYLRIKKYIIENPVNLE
jgi:putative transposase